MPEDHHLVGREKEFEAIVGLLRPREGPARLCAIVGESGIGKTSLLEAAVATAAADGRRVLRCRPAETESRLSFVCLGDLLDGADDALSDLAGPQRSALSRALLLDEGESEVDERAVAVGFLNCLRGLASDQPLLLVVDDAQWADAPSVAALRFALARLDAEPVTVLVAARGDGVAWLRTDRMSAITLEGLSFGALHLLLRERFDRPPSRPALVRIHETSGGNPFYALELAHALDRRGGALDSDGNLPFPAKLDELVAERLDELSAAAEERRTRDRDPRRAVSAFARGRRRRCRGGGQCGGDLGRPRRPAGTGAIQSPVARVGDPCARVRTKPARHARSMRRCRDRSGAARAAPRTRDGPPRRRSRGCACGGRRASSSSGCRVGRSRARASRARVDSERAKPRCDRHGRRSPAGSLYDAGDGEGGIAILEEALAEAAPGGRGLLLVELA